MDWKRLIQFALTGNANLEQYAILLVRVSIGLFFAISGANKLFVAGGTKPVYDTLVQAKVPFPHFTAYFVSAAEFFCGSLVAVGFFSSFGSLALLIDMIVATLTSAVMTVPKGLSFLRWLDDFLYLPEVLYVLFFIWLICSGPGRTRALREIASRCGIAGLDVALRRLHRNEADHRSGTEHHRRRSLKGV